MTRFISFFACHLFLLCPMIPLLFSPTRRVPGFVLDVFPLILPGLVPC